MIIANNYEVQERLGQGGMGVVFLAKDLALDKLVAVKMLNPVFAQDESFLARFRVEARAQAKFDHPNVVRIHSFLEYEKNYYLVMEYVNGDTLDALIRTARQGLGFEQAWPIFNQTLMAFETAHDLGIIHRDIKPKNILIDATGRVKVADFGLARIQGQSGLTTKSISGGTLAYMSPEQIKGLGDVDFRTDIYSLGMTMYETLSGAIPFAKEQSDYHTREAIVKGKIPRLEKFRPQIPRELAKVVMKALATDRNDRFRNVREMRTALERFVHAAESDRTVFDVELPPSPKMTTAKHERKRHALLVLGAVMIALLCFAVFRFTRQPEQAAKGADDPPAPITPSKYPVRITSSPQAASIELDGHLRGQTPLDDSLQQGRYRVILKKNGYLAIDTVLVVENSEIVLNAVLLQEHSTVPAPQPAKAEEKFRGNRNEAEAAKREMTAAKQQVPGSEQDQRANTAYRQALEAEIAAQRRFEAGDFAVSQGLFENASAGYAAAAAALTLNVSAAQEVEAAKTAMLQAKSKIEPKSHGEAKFQQANQIEKEANRAYADNDFGAAGERYNAAQQLYAAVAVESREKLKREDEAGTAQQEIQSLIGQYRRSLEKADIQGVRVLFANSSTKAAEERAWAGFFQAAKNIKVFIKNGEPQLDYKSAEITLAVRIEYENDRGAKQKPANLQEIWKLEKIDNKWVIVEVAH